jgi:hypothetical protein
MFLVIQSKAIATSTNLTRQDLLSGITAPNLLGGIIQTSKKKTKQQNEKHSYKVTPGYWSGILHHKHCCTT